MVDKIKQYLGKFNFSIRKKKDARFMDQKVTPDVLCIIADCVLQFVGDDINKKFTTNDIWKSNYANENVKDIFNKPDVLNDSARSEYDKFFAQPLRMLAYSQVLKRTKKRNRNSFSIRNYELLNYISIKERNSLNFLALYLEKVFRDSNIWSLFEDFFVINDKEHFNLLKDGFREVLYKYTEIKKTNRYEPGRIFAKVINPLSYVMKSHGTKGGFFSPDIIGYDELMYNRRNWRDITKRREETRQEYEIRAKREVARSKSAFVKFTIGKAIRLIKLRCNGISEIRDAFANGQATQVHHIFPKPDFPLIKAYLENLILLTGTQHSTKAHPGNNTRRIDKEYQLLCLLSKSVSIQESLSSNDGFYSKEDFVFVLNEGIKPHSEFVVEESFCEIKRKLSDEYNRS